VAATGDRHWWPRRVAATGDCHRQLRWVRGGAALLARIRLIASYRLDDGIAYLPLESERQLRIGTVFPRSLPKKLKQEPDKGVLPSNGNAPPLLLPGRVRPSRVLWLSRAKRR